MTPLDVLVVEPDSALCISLTRALVALGLTVDVAATVTESKRLLARETYRAVLLSMGLPDGTGLDVLAYIREQDSADALILLMLEPEDAAIEAFEPSALPAALFRPIDCTQVAGNLMSVLRRGQK